MIFEIATFGLSPTGMSLQGFPYRDNYPCEVIPVALMSKKRSELGVGGSN